MAPKQKDVKFTIVGSDQVQCSLSLLSFFPKNINITWSHKEQSNTTLSSTKKIIQTNDEEIFDAISECIVPWKSFKSSIRVTWKHESLTQPEYRILCITGTAIFKVTVQCISHPLDNSSDQSTTVQSSVQYRQQFWSNYPSYPSYPSLRIDLIIT